MFFKLASEIYIIKLKKQNDSHCVIDMTVVFPLGLFQLKLEFPVPTKLII